MKMRKTRLTVWSIVTGVMLVLTIASIVGSAITNRYSAAINAYFNVLPYKLVDVEDGEVIDKEYYKSSFVTSNGNYDDQALYDYDLRVSQQITSEGSVLLWNNSNGLPLSDKAAVSLFGNTSVNAVYTGTGSGSINVNTAVDLKTSMEHYDFKVNSALWDFYATGKGSKDSGYGITQKGSAGIATNEALYTREVPWGVISGESNIVNSFNEYSDAAIFVLGRSGGEGGDLSYTGAPDTLDGNYLQLSSVERDVLDNLINLKNAGKFKKIVLLINSANAMQMDIISQYEDAVDACMWIGQPGAGGMPGVAKLLAGKSNPSGRLVDTYVYDNASSPAMVNFYLHRYENKNSYSLDDTQTAYTVYQEGIYVGYKYYETRYEDVVLGQGNAGSYDYTSTVKYPFGYGLSYSTFAYSNYSVTEKADKDIEIKVTVTNTGSVAGREVVQIYLSKPYTDYDKTNKIEKSAVELVGYAKTKILDIGDSQELTITVDDQDLKSYDGYGYKTYIRESGSYYFAAGKDAHDALNNVLAAKKADGITVDTSKMKTVDGSATSGDASLAKAVKYASLDAETYSKSVHTGVKIENKFDFSDINKYENAGDNKVTYLTRNDWTGTFPTAAPTLKLNDKMAEHLACERDLEETKKDAEAFYEKHGEIKYGQQNGLSLIQLKDLPFDAPEWDQLLDQMSWDEQAELCSNGYHTTAIVPSVNKPATRDENGPLGISVTFSTSTARASMGWPCEPTRAATFNVALNELMGRCLGEDMLHAGVNGLWGYGLNIHRTPYSGRNFEYYSEDSFISGETCAYETVGAQSRGAFVMVKHFAANDSETQRHGNNVWITEQALRETYLSPFETEFTEGKAWSTMTSYNRLGCEWTGGCYNLLNEVLRGEWGFEGYTSSDYAGKSRDTAYYQNVYIGIQAGCDTYDANFHKDEYDDVKIENAKTDEEKETAKLFQYCLRMSSKRICYAIVHTAAMNGIGSKTKVVPVLTFWQKWLVALQCTLGGITLVCAAFLTLSVISFVKEKNSSAADSQTVTTE